MLAWFKLARPLFLEMKEVLIYVTSSWDQHLSKLHGQDFLEACCFLRPIITRVCPILDFRWLVEGDLDQITKGIGSFYFSQQNGSSWHCPSPPLVDEIRPPNSSLVDPASSHILVSKLKLCKYQYKHDIECCTI